MTLPNLLIAGVSHGGTTSLHTYLSSHPEICGSRIKETHYFYPIMIGEELTPIQEYAHFFSHHKGERYIMESGPGYLYGSMKIANVIKETLGTVKLIFLIRDPVTLIYSLFKYLNKTMVIEKMSFQTFVEALAGKTDLIKPKNIFEIKSQMAWGLESGFYAKYLQDWYSVFGEQSIQVVFFDDLQQRPSELLKDIYQWLGLDIHFPANITIENKGFYYRNKFIHKQLLLINEKFEPFFRTYPSIKQNLRKLYMLNTKKNPFALDDVTRNLLIDLYTPHNNQLYSLLKSKGIASERMPEWLKKS